MKATELSELKKVINTIFERGPNKAQAMQALENFIDRNYVSTRSPLIRLGKEIEESGGVAQWKLSLKSSIKKELLEILRKDYSSWDKTY